MLLAAVALVAPPGAAWALTPTSGRVTTCGTRLCVGFGPWPLYGASVYGSTSDPARSGVDNPSATVALAGQAGLNAIRIVNFYDSSRGDPLRDPYREDRWLRVDRLIALASAGGLHVLLDLSDYRNLLWNNCVDPYAQDWSTFLGFVAHRRNTATWSCGT